MDKNQKKFFISLGLIILFILLFLVVEIRKFNKITTETTSEPIYADKATPLNISTGENHVIGTGNLWVVAYLDLNDSKSRKIYQTVVDFVRSSGNLTKAQFFLKHAPVAGILNDNTIPNKSAWCAKQQNKLTPYLDALVNLNGVKEKNLREAAKTAGLKIDQWWACTGGERAAAAVSKDTEEAKGLNMGKPPLLFINNKKINTNQDFDLLKLLNSLIVD